MYRTTLEELYLMCCDMDNAQKFCISCFGVITKTFIFESWHEIPEHIKEYHVVTFSYRAEDNAWYINLTSV